MYFDYNELPCSVAQPFTLSDWQKNEWKLVFGCLCPECVLDQPVVNVFIVLNLCI